jgi:hypothetical protein
MVVSLRCLNHVIELVMGYTTFDSVADAAYNLYRVKQSQAYDLM